MLKSVGMTPKGFNKMINYESIFYGIKSLLYGLPISIGVMYLIYNAMSDSFDYPFRLPLVKYFIYDYCCVYHRRFSNALLRLKSEEGKYY